MRVNKKNNDIITCSSVLNHLRSKRVCVFYSLLFLALLEVRTYSRKTTSIDWRDSRRVIFSRFLPRAMVASTVFEADSARCFHSNALGRANIATRQVFSNVQKFKDWIQKCWLFSFTSSSFVRRLYSDWHMIHHHHHRKWSILTTGPSLVRRFSPGRRKLRLEFKRATVLPARNWKSQIVPTTTEISNPSQSFRSLFGIAGA
jgi:hypothetical protein